MRTPPRMTRGRWKIAGARGMPTDCYVATCDDSTVTLRASEGAVPYRSARANARAAAALPDVLKAAAAMIPPRMAKQRTIVAVNGILLWELRRALLRAGCLENKKAKHDTDNHRRRPTSAL